MCLLNVMNYSFLKDEGGHKVKEHFSTLLDSYTDDYDCTEYIDDSQINQELIIHENDSIPSFQFQWMRFITFCIHIYKS